MNVFALTFNPQPHFEGLVLNRFLFFISDNNVQFIIIYYTKKKKRNSTRIYPWNIYLSISKAFEFQTFSDSVEIM